MILQVGEPIALKGVFRVGLVVNHFGKAELKTSHFATPWTRIFLLTSISSSTMCTLPSDPFIEPFYSLKKAFTRLLPPAPQSADCASINIARPSSAPPILLSPSSTIRTANIAMPVTSKMFFNLSAPKWTLTADWVKFPGDQVHVSTGGMVERSQQALPISTGLDSPQTSIIHYW